MDEAAYLALAGHRFPGGVRSFDRWENVILTDCTVRDPLPDELVHPIAAFNMSINGTGTTLTELFALCEVVDVGAVWLEFYDWNFHRQLREGVEYKLSGGIDVAERAQSSSGRSYDRLEFTVNLEEPEGDLAVEVTTAWRIHR